MRTYPFISNYLQSSGWELTRHDFTESLGFVKYIITIVYMLKTAYSCTYASSASPPKILRRKHPRWLNRIGAEQTNVFSGAPRLQPDIIVRHPDGLQCPGLSSSGTGGLSAQGAGWKFTPVGWTPDNSGSNLEGGTIPGDRSQVRSFSHACPLIIGTF